MHISGLLMRSVTPPALMEFALFLLITYMTSLEGLCLVQVLKEPV